MYSPAAYFVELRALVEGTFDRPSLLERRPDLKQVLLDAEHTFTETPYLDIVNEVLERLVVDGTHDDPYEVLRNRKHPFGLPFSLPAEKLAKYLHHLQVTPLELYRLFAAPIDHDIAAREYLALSPEDVAVVTTSAANDDELKACYGLAATDSLGELQDAERFAEATGLTGDELRELVKVRPPVTVSADGTRLEWGDPVPTDWLDLVHRFVRLARMTGLGFTDLDLVLDSCCAGRIDRAGLRSLAVVLRLTRVHDLTVTDVCRLVVPVESEEVRAARATSSPHATGTTGHGWRAGSRSPRARSSRSCGVTASTTARRSPARSTGVTSGCPRSGCCTARVTSPTPWASRGRAVRRAARPGERPVPAPAHDVPSPGRHRAATPRLLRHPRGR